MGNQKDDKYYIEKVIEHIDVILKHTKNITYDAFLDDEMLIDATMFRLIQMVENINHISKEYKEQHSSVEWGLIVGFRNGIVHEYGKTDYAIVYETITKDIIELRKELKESIK